MAKDAILTQPHAAELVNVKTVAKRLTRECVSVTDRSTDRLCRVHTIINGSFVISVLNHSYFERKVRLIFGKRENKMDNDLNVPNIYRVIL